MSYKANEDLFFKEVCGDDVSQRKAREFRDRDYQ